MQFVKNSVDGSYYPPNSYTQEVLYREVHSQTKTVVHFITSRIRAVVIPILASFADFCISLKPLPKLFLLQLKVHEIKISAVSFVVLSLLTAMSPLSLINPDFLHEQVLLAELNKWVEDPLAKGNKEEAKEIMMETFRKRETVLILRSLDLNKLPPSVCFRKFAYLQQLQLGYNALTTVPEEVFRPLRNLGYLSLQYNKLSEFGDIDCPELYTLDLNDNNLSKMGEIKCPKLNTLNLSYNKQLGTLPSGLSNIKSLESILFRNTNVPEEVVDSILPQKASVWHG